MNFNKSLAWLWPKTMTSKRLGETVHISSRDTQEKTTLSKEIKKLEAIPTNAMTERLFKK